jgi:ATP-dependent Clp protease ATP-binding subunit ClpX
MKRDEALRCSFCKKSQDEVGKIITSPAEPRAYICDECVAVCNSIVEDDRLDSIGEATITIFMPQEQAARLEALAEAHGITIESLARQAVAALLVDMPNEQP